MDEATRTKRLAEAEDALHKLILGRQSVTVIADGGYSVTYTPANIDRLRAYIAELRNARISVVKIAASKGLCS
jgi:hypothetical protein